MKFHLHKWIFTELIDEYLDYNGFAIQIWECKCSKCGKTKKRKFW